MRLLLLLFFTHCIMEHSCLTKWVMFAQHHLLSEAVPLGVEEVARPGCAHHLNQDGSDTQAH